LPPGVDLVSFADDTTILVDLRGLSSPAAVDRVRQASERVAEAAAQLCLELNATKTKLVVFESKRGGSPPSDLSVSLRGESLVGEDSAVALGVILNGNLRWDGQIQKILGRGRAVVAGLRRLKAVGFPLNVMVLAYKAFFLPVIRYCITVWGATYYNVRAKVILLQKDSVRAILGLGWRESVKSHMREHALLDVDNYYKLILAVYVYKWSTRRLPRNEGFDWERLTAIDKNLRNDRSLDVSRGSKLPNYVRRAPREAGGELWNGLPIDIRRASSVAVFKRLLGRHLLLAQY